MASNPSSGSILSNGSASTSTGDTSPLAATGPTRSTPIDPNSSTRNWKASGSESCRTPESRATTPTLTQLACNFFSNCKIHLFNRQYENQSTWDYCCSSCCRFRFADRVRYSYSNFLRNVSRELQGGCLPANQPGQCPCKGIAAESHGLRDGRESPPACYPRDD